MSVAGFVGNEDGLTENQIKSLEDLLIQKDVKTFHHGDCLGSDYQAHCVALGIQTVHNAVHPPLYTDKRLAYSPCPVWQFPFKDEKQRYKDIVDMSEFLIFAPWNELDEIEQYNNLYPVKYAERKKKNIYAIRPSGRVEVYLTNKRKAMENIT